jgi:hypothetical protein
MLNVVIGFNNQNYFNIVKRLFSLLDDEVEFNNLSKKPDLIIFACSLFCADNKVRYIRKYIRQEVPYIMWSKEIHFAKKAHYKPICWINHASNKESILFLREEYRSIDNKKWREYDMTDECIHFNIPLSLYRPDDIDIYNIKKYKNKERKYNCVLITKHHNTRRLIFEALQKKIDKVVSLGSYLRTPGTKNIPGDWSNLDEIYSQTYFAIAVENTDLMEGGSEKIMNVFRGGAIPIYYESESKIEKKSIEHYYNKNAMINTKDFSDFDELADHVANLLKDKENLYKMMDEPALATPISEKFKLFEDPP